MPLGLMKDIRFLNLRGKLERPQEKIFPTQIVGATERKIENNNQNLIEEKKKQKCGRLKNFSYKLLNNSHLFYLARRRKNRYNKFIDIHKRKMSKSTQQTSSACNGKQTNINTTTLLQYDENYNTTLKKKVFLN